MQIHFKLFALIGWFLVSVPCHAATRDARGNVTPSDAEIGALLKTVCAIALRKGKDWWTCDRATNYPNQRGRGDCDVVFGRGDMYFGRFTGNRISLLARYGSSCETRATRGGGAVFFDIRPDGSKLIKYYPGMIRAILESCMIVTMPKQVDKLYCLLMSTDLGNEFGFAVLNFIRGGREIKFDWLIGGDIDETRPAVTSCKDVGTSNGLTPISVDPLNPSWVIKVMGGTDEAILTRSGNDLIVSLEYRMVTPEALKTACARLASGKFAPGEIETRERFRLPKDQVELHDDEFTIKPVWLVFTPPSKKPRLSLTKP